ncbi:hypothetical protein EPI10_006875 [Gossypium australe]|uniref:Uncharacterized protein n=1 Tax=Gossypium australe TaxID=47621 RepID=A0A5B6WU15_9ROSI|nr:hypothetical protein EPI10_006875 [Gossypium australe]
MENTWVEDFSPRKSLGKDITGPKLRKMYMSSFAHVILAKGTMTANRTSSDHVKPLGICNLGSQHPQPIPHSHEIEEIHSCRDGLFHQID